jgi:uncharacterized protein YccT (UPF0319 family)
LFKPLLMSIVLSSGVYATAIYAANIAADVSLDVPEVIHILSIDGQEQASSFFGSRTHVKKLSAGEHVLSLRYSQLFNTSSEDHDIVKSPPMAIRFVAEAGQQYQLVVNPPKRHEAAVKFAKQPDIKLINKITGTTQQAIAIKSYSEASLIDTLGKAFNTSDSSAPHNTTFSSNNTQLLQDIWLRATPQERQAFAAWLASQAATNK